MADIWNILVRVGVKIKYDISGKTTILQVLEKVFGNSIFMAKIFIIY